MTLSTSQPLQDGSAVFLSIFPITIHGEDMSTGSVDATMNRFRSDFCYDHVEPYARMAQEGAHVAVEMLVDFPWPLHMYRFYGPRRVPWSGFKSDSGDWTREELVKRVLLPGEAFRQDAQRAFFTFGEQALGYLSQTPLRDTTMALEGFGERRVAGTASPITVAITSEYDVHMLPCRPAERERLDHDLNELVMLGGTSPYSDNSVRAALEWADNQPDCHNLEFGGNSVYLRPDDIMGCSLSEIAITLDRVQRQEGTRVFYVAAYNAGTRAHRTRFGPDTPYARAIEPALGTLLTNRSGRHVSVKSEFYGR
ncbi:MAG: hypothetical protein HYY37_05625 [Candidatus Aenigmarchaeota archaeon]|nr:hypothetical protein [Candidatus Aenigmarchaeota archaeon]